MAIQMLLIEVDLLQMENKLVQFQLINHLSYGVLVKMNQF